MPELNPKTIQETHRVLSNTADQMGKFIRNGELILWGHANSQHRSMLEEARLTSLDDHGFLLAFNLGGSNYLTVSLQANGLNDRLFPVTDSGRLRTAEIIKGFAQKAAFQLNVDHDL